MIIQRFHTPVPFIALLLAAAALSFPGCGGGSDDSATASALTKQQFIKRANAICQEAIEKVDLQLREAAEAQPGNGQLSEGALELVATTVVFPIYAETFSKLGSLQPPEESKEEVRKIVDQYQAALKKTEANPRLGFRHNPFLKGSEAAEKFGLEACRL